MIGSSGTQPTVLFIHQNMPGQFLHLCKHLRDNACKVVFLTRNSVNQLRGVLKVLYKPARDVGHHVHPYLRSVEDGVLHGQAVFRSIKGLLSRGIRPDIVIGHSGWGETMFVRDALPDVPIINYFEFFYRSTGSDINFDCEYPSDIDGVLTARVKNTIALQAYAATNAGLTPTRWQQSTFPSFFREKVSVIHEGIDTGEVRFNANATYKLENGRVLVPGMKVVTFVARSLEPYRGFHTFIRAIPELQRRHSDAEVVIVGSEGVSYGQRLPPGESYKKRLLSEVPLDLGRVHFTGHIPVAALRSLMSISAAHVYLTYPFVLSWSMLEAMACECLIIGSDTEPVQEVIVDGYNGFLTNFFDQKALVDQLDKVLSEPERYRSLREAARTTIVAGYDLKAVCLPKQLGLIENLVQRGS